MSSNRVTDYTVSETYYGRRTHSLTHLFYYFITFVHNFKSRHTKGESV